MSRFGLILLLVIVLASVRPLKADTAAFDLSGPRIDVRVTRGAKTLPISQVPNLQAGDRIWLHPDLPEDQSARYLLVAVFLRGSTNPPPDNWFTKAETWNKKVRTEGIVITVPPDAQQLLLFLAPETGGDFGTLRSAVQGKPGAFVRASQDLNQASFDRSRLDKYITAVKQTSDTDPKALQERSTLLARSLAIKLNPDCFDKPVEQQSSCLTQHTDQLVLDDGHSQSMVAALTSGASSDLIGQVSNTRLAGGGYYSAYVGAIVDLARIMGNLHTATYQYIPALVLRDHEHLNLKLNNPPSFHKPKSVLVIALPAVEAAQLPPIRAVDSKQVFCLQQPSLVLPVEGAPLVFSTGLAHDFAIRVQTANGSSMELPAMADAARGGFAIDTPALQETQLAPRSVGKLHGFWGYQAFTGPEFELRSAHAAKWNVAPSDQSALITGREDTLHLQSEGAVCIQNITLKDQKSKEIQATWKLTKPDELEVRIPLQEASPGPVTLLITQSGMTKPDELALHAYSEAAHLERFSINAGDRQAVLTGTRLDEVSKVDLNGIAFLPAGLSRANEKDELRLSTTHAPASGLQPGQELRASVTLNDGRTLELPATVAPPRPKVTLVSKSIQKPATSPIHLESDDDLPQDGRLSFVLKSEIPETFPRTEKIEVAAGDSSFNVLLNVDDGNLVLQDSRTLLVIVDPLKQFGVSAFGPLRFRPVTADGLKGDWQPLVSLVRVPSLNEIRCPTEPDQQCTLKGANLFLIDSIASDAEFKHTVPIPAGFLDTNVTVPRTEGAAFYIKLRDDPSKVNKVLLAPVPE
jgi:hypothetical protein